MCDSEVEERNTNAKRQRISKARNKLFTEIVPITDDNSAYAAIIALEQRMESGKAIINVAEISRLYMYAYIYHRCAKLALTAVLTTGRKEK
ncbi:35037_t:CDS:2 [Gigaspora margarita]|uniref:35037_t:CDS:1 n=1 Tax=Gigaspora margarita TaxID=4874 RepID=A0ABN7UY90_GIGMA|nr:35037_t:CDS:2 [Gigaspora margarita]